MYGMGRPRSLSKSAFFWAALDSTFHAAHSAARLYQSARPPPPAAGPPFSWATATPPTDPGLLGSIIVAASASSHAMRTCLSASSS